MAVFVMGLDKTVITTAIPKITSEFHSLQDVGWYGSSYLLTLMALQPTFGKIYTYFDIKRVFICALLIFESGSIVCATAPNSEAFIVGRAIAGIGSAGQLSGGMTIIGFTVPLKNRAMFYAFLQSMNAIASVVGPPLGGVFTDSSKLTWRFCFWINLPIGGLATLIFILVFRTPSRPTSDLSFRHKIAKMDLPGASIFIAAIVCLLLALQWGGTKYPWSHSTVWGCLLGSGLLLLVFLAWQLRLGDEGTIPPRILANKTVDASFVFTAMVSIGLSVHPYFLPFYFQSAKGLSAEAPGLRTIPYLFSITIAAIAVGSLVAALGKYHPFLWSGAVIYTIGSGLLYTVQVNSSAGKWIGYQILAGAGIGSTQQISAIAIQAALSAEDMPVGNALIVFFQNLAGSVAVSTAENIFTHTLRQRLVKTVPQINAQQVITAGATNIKSVVPAALLKPVLGAYSFAVARAFILPIAAGGIAFLSVSLIDHKSVGDNKQGTKQKDGDV